MEFDEADGRLRASLPEHPEPSEGLRVLLRLCEVLASAELDRPLIFLSYPLGDMDTDVVDVVWEFCGLTLPTSPPPQLQFFVPIAVGDVSVKHHCIPQNPVRFAVQRGRLIERRAPADLDTAIRNVLLQLDQPMVLFLGAGASASAGITIADPIRDEALRRLVGSRASVDDLLAAFQNYLEREDRWRPGERDLLPDQFRNRLTLERVLREEFHGLGGRSLSLSPSIARISREAESALERLPEGRKALRRLVTRLPRLVILTVNFDRLIEDGLDVDHQVAATPQAFEDHTQVVVDKISGATDKVPILKLHGTIENPDTVVATIDKTEFGLPPQIAATLDAMVAAADGPLTWVWIGCSMRDADLRIWLGNQHGVDQLNEWWVDPLPSEALFEYARFVRERHWATVEHSLKDRLITETADVFLQRLDAHAAGLAER
jgi:SIR2-like domain